MHLSWISADIYQELECAHILTGYADVDISFIITLISSYSNETATSSTFDNMSQAWLSSHHIGWICNASAGGQLSIGAIYLSCKRGDILCI